MTVSERLDGAAPATPPTAGRWIAIGGAAIAIAIGATLLATWWAGPEGAVLASTRMKANTALGVVLLGVALLGRALSGRSAPAWRERVATVAASAAAVLGALTLFEYGAGVDLGIDELLARDPDPVGETAGFPNRMAPNAALAILGAGLAILTSRVPRLGLLAQGLAAIVHAICLLAIVGYLYAVRELYQPTAFIRISPFTSVAILAVTSGTVALRSDVGIARLLGDRGAAGLLARPMIVIAVLLPIALGWLRLDAERSGLLPGANATAVLVLTMVLTLIAVVLALASSLSSHDARRRAVEEQLLRVARLDSALARAATVGDVAAATLGAGLDALGANGGALLRLASDGRALRLAAAHRLNDAGLAAYSVIPLERRTPVTDAARTGRAVFVASREELQRAYAIDDAHIGPHRSWAAIPLHGGERLLGVLALSFAEAESFDAERRQRLERLSTRCAQALERALALEVLEEATQRLHAALDAAAIGTYVWHVETGSIDHDAGIEHIFGLDPAAADSLESYVQRIHPDDREAFVAGLEACRREARDFEQRFRVVLPDGSIRWVLDKGRMVRSAEGRAEHLAGAIVDLTAEHAAREALERANRTKDEFLAMLGHELRNPLAPMRTALELMRMRPDGVHERARAVIERQVTHMVRLVDDLLDVSRITRGTIELRRAPLELHAVTAKAIEIAAPLFEKKRQRVVCTVPLEGLPVIGDEHRLTQVIANLLTNAGRYGRREGDVEISARVDGRDVEIAVHDDGAGIAPELMPRIFDLFVQGARSIDRGDGGLGLGLAIARTLVEMHGGTIRAASDGPGLGATFTVRLPLATRAGAEADAARAVEVGETASASRSRRVLVVDDNQDAAEMLGELLRAAGHSVQLAFDGPTAIDAAAASAPHVAFLDIGLPVMDGYELARRLRATASGRSAILVALTGYGLESDRARSAEAGFDGHLVKPVRLEEVMAIVDGGIERARAAAG